MRSAILVLFVLLISASIFAQNRMGSTDYAQLKRELAHVKYISCPPKAAIRYTEKTRKRQPVKRKYRLASGKLLFRSSYKYEGDMLVSKKFTTPALSVAPFVKTVFNYGDAGEIVLVDIMHRKDAGGRVHQTNITKFVSPSGKVTQKVSKTSWSSTSAAQIAEQSRKNTEAMMRRQKQSSDAFVNALANSSSSRRTSGSAGVVILGDQHPSSCNRYYSYRHHYDPRDERSVPYYGTNPHYYSRFVDHPYAKVKYYYNGNNRLSKMSFRDRSNLTVGYVRYYYDHSGNLTDIRFYWNNRLEKRFRFRFDSNNRLTERAAYNGQGQLIY